MLPKAILCVLVVEDYAPIREMLQEILELDGYRAVTAVSGYAALHFLSTTIVLPDLIIADIRMPGMDGYEFIQVVQASEKWRRIPALLASALMSKQKADIGLPAGVCGYISKPFDVPQMLATIAQVIATYTMQQA